jgi:hypothetical protein
VSDWTESFPHPDDHDDHAEHTHDPSHHLDGRFDAAAGADQHSVVADDDQPLGAPELLDPDESAVPTGESMPEWSAAWSDHIADHEYQPDWLHPDALPQPTDEPVGWPGGPEEPGVPGPAELADWAARAWQAEFGDDPTASRSAPPDTAALLADLADRAVDGQRQAASRAALGMIAGDARDAAEAE